MMRTNFPIVVVALVLAVSAVAQSSDPDGLIRSPQAERLSQTFCGAPLAGYEAGQTDRFKAVTDSLLKVTSTLSHPMVYMVIQSNAVNAWAKIAPAKGYGIAGVVCVPIAMVRFLPDNDELEAVMAHETGHTLDRDCYFYVLGQAKSLSSERSCEQRADQWGMQLLLDARISPYAMAGSFGRLEVYSGDIKTNIFSRIEGLFSDHPITPDRMEDIRQELIRYNQTRTISLSPVVR